MFRYLALLFDHLATPATINEIESQLTSNSSSRWRLVFNAPSLHLWCTGAEDEPGFPITICREGVVLGPLFRSPALHEGTSDLTASTAMSDIWLRDATQMVRASWGDYVAFHIAQHAHCVRILKDPVGVLPALYLVRDDLHLVFSCLSDVIDLGFGPFRANRDYLQRFVCRSTSGTREKALQGVARLAGGESLEINFGHRPARLTRLQHWNPATIAIEERLDHPATARQALHATALACTRAAASRHPRIVHRLSGGLDSSIVLGCLRHVRSNITSYAYFDPHGRGDARSWARLAATHAELSCLEHPFVPEETPLPKIATFAPTLEPVATLSFLQRSPFERSLCKQYGASAVFTGLGGDSGFCRDSVSFTVLDHISLHGINPTAIALSASVARHTDQSVWSVLIDAARHRWLGMPYRELPVTYAQMSQLVSPELLRQNLQPAAPHPWLADAGRLPSLHRRLASLLQPSEFYDISILRSEVAPAIVSPLLSQPMVELCLRIPIYIHFDQGIERGLARRAFVQEVPAAILQRRWKDRAPGVAERILATHRNFAREFLLDGILVSEGLLSKRAVAAAFGTQAARSQVTAIEILTHLDTEAWLRHWR